MPRPVGDDSGPGGDVGRDIPLTPDTMLVSGLVPRSTTLDGLLRGHGVADEAALGVVNAAREVFDPRRLRALQPFSLERTLEGTIRFFQYEIDNDRFLRIAPPAAGSPFLDAAVVPIPKTLEHVTAAGRIDRQTPSLFQSVSSAGEGAELAVALADIFSGEIDFNSDLQPGDAYALAFDKYTREGGASNYGAISAAEFRNDGRTLRAIRFTVPGGKAAYYDERGRSLRRFFLRSPLKFEPRITSRFSSSRRHPVLHTARAHRGVDYAAPTGAPVIAAASGVVVAASYDRTNGRMVRVRHASGYESVLPPPLGVRPRHPLGRARGSGPDRRSRGRHRPCDRSTPALRPQAQRRVREPASRAPQSAAGRRRFRPPRWRRSRSSATRRSRSSTPPARPQTTRWVPDFIPRGTPLPDRRASRARRASRTRRAR